MGTLVKSEITSSDIKLILLLMCVPFNLLTKSVGKEYNRIDENNIVKSLLRLI